MKPSGVITITTDFGHKGPFTAIMKGVIVQRFPDAYVIDLIHDIPAQWPPEAGFWVSSSYRFFPPGSMHIAIVDPGVGTGRKILLAECDGHLFMAPDNGLLARLLERNPDAKVYHLNATVLEQLGLGEPSSTFHGRDIFAPVAAEIASGRLHLSDIGTPTNDWTPDWIDDPEFAGNKVTGVIVTVDTFGNLISNIESAHIESFENPVVHFAGKDLPMMQTYGMATPGDYLAVVNSFDMVEIAKAEGNAAAGLGADRGAPISVTDG